MKRKILALILATTMICCLFTACGTSNTNQNNTEVGNNTTTETEQQPTEKEVKLLKTACIKGSLFKSYEYNEYGEKIEEVFYSNKDGEKVVYFYTTYEYDEYGTLIKDISHTEYNGKATDASTDSKIYEYDEQGRLIYEHSSWDKGETYDTTTEYIYDENGDMVENRFIEVIDGENDYIAYKDICEYDENHNCIKMTEYKYELEKVDGEDYWSPTLEVLTDEHVYTYDSNNNLLSEIHNQYDDYYYDTETIYTYKYDSNNNKIEYGKVFYRDGELISNEVTTYKYDEHNNCIEEKETDVISNHTYTITYQYEYFEDGEYNIVTNHGGDIYTAHYDEFGNFLESIGGEDAGYSEYETRTVKIRPTR